MSDNVCVFAWVYLSSFHFAHIDLALQVEFNTHTHTHTHIYIYIYIYIWEPRDGNHQWRWSIHIYTYHHHHVVPPAQISLTLSRHFSLSFISSGRSSGLHPVSLYIYIYIYIYIWLVYFHTWWLSLDSHKRKEKKHLYIRRLNWQMLVQHEYHSLRNYDYIPVTSRGKITSNHKNPTVYNEFSFWLWFSTNSLYSPIDIIIIFGEITLLLIPDCSANVGIQSYCYL